MTPAQAKRQRAALMRDVARELKRGNRKKLVALRDRLHTAKAERRAAHRQALAQCRASRAPLPTVKQLAAELRAAKRDAKSACDLDLAAARALGGKVKRARAELASEKKYQRELQRIERGNRAKLKAARTPGLARARTSQSDDEVRQNIPPELAALFERVKRSIRGSERKTRTEAFLEYAEEHPDEEWAALEGSVDRAIEEMERRQAMPNPKKKKRARKAQKRKNPELSIDPPRARRRRKKKAAAAPPPTIVVKTNPKKKRKAAKKRAAPKRARRRARAEGRWFDRVLASALGRKHARDRMRADLNAGWYRQSPATRAGHVRSLARGTPKEKRAAVAIAKAEQAHADGPRRKKNPGMSEADAKAEYERTHWGERGRGRSSSAKAADPRHGTAAKLGELVAVVYRTKKGGDDGLTDYEHAFEGRRPTLVYNNGGLMIAGGDYVIKEGGIDG
jgi:hypothetical protein